MNVNCLEGVACPECGNDRMISVVALVLVDVTDDGADISENNDGYEYDEDSFAECPECEYAGKFGTFSVR